MLQTNGTLSEHAYVVLKEKLLTMEGGAYLSMRQFANEIGMSYTPVREAFLRLQNEGALKQIPNVGFLVATMDIKEILQLLLLPGFSTNEDVTEFSGRGVGMDVVKRNIEKVGGVVNMSTEVGKGTTSMLNIPLTLAIVDGMEIVVGESIFTIPLHNIRSSFKVKDQDIIYDASGGEIIRRMESFYPVIRLHDFYGIDNAATSVEEGIMIWIEAGDKSYCLFVDKLVGEQQVVVKPLPNYLYAFNIKNLGIAGCTILGDGNISIILDAPSLYEAAVSRM